VARHAQGLFEIFEKQRGTFALGRQFTAGDRALRVALHVIDRLHVQRSGFARNPPEPSREAAAQRRRLGGIESHCDCLADAQRRRTPEQARIRCRQPAEGRRSGEWADRRRIRTGEEGLVCGHEVSVERVRSAESAVGQRLRQAEPENQALIGVLQCGQSVQGRRRFAVRRLHADGAVERTEW
jgi:hypothetical protein